MDGVEGLDISPALEATEDFLHCLHDQRHLQNHTVDLQHFRQPKRHQDVSKLEKLSSSNVWRLLAREQSEFGPLSFAWANQQPPPAVSTLGQGNGLRHAKKSRAQSTNDLASHSKDCSNISNSVFRKGHNRSRSDVNYRPSTCTDNGPLDAGTPKDTDIDAAKDASRGVVVKQAEMEHRQGPGWSRCHLQLTPCELRLYAVDSSANHQLVTAYSLSHCQSVSSPAPHVHRSQGVQTQAADERTLHALFFNSTHLQLRTESKWEALQWRRLIWERVLATRPTEQKQQLNNKACENNPSVAQFHKPLCLLSTSHRPTALPLFTQHGQDTLKVGLLHLLMEQNNWRTFTFVLTPTLLQGFLTEGRGPVAEPVFQYHLATCVHVEHDSNNVHPRRCSAGLGNIFKAVFPREVLWLQADSRVEARSWVDLLCKTVEVQRPSHRPEEDIHEDTSMLKVELHRSPVQRQRNDQQENRSVTSTFLSILTCLAVEKGLTAQSFKCAGCQGPVGVSGGKARVCCYSGWYYCTSCHQDNTAIIPARLLHNWDTGKHKVSKQAKEFLEFVYEEPLLDLQLLNPFLYQHCEPLRAVLQLRQRLQSLRAYLFSCRATVAEDLRRRIFPREYLLQHIHLYSMADLQQVIDGKLAPFLSKVIKFASSHVFSCSLCQEKGFICELCKNGQVIYPFQESATKRCKGCDAVFHAECHQKTQPCPRCVRREMHKRHSAFCFNEDDDIPDCYQNT
ncbi:unnamed protein product [Merluccius merluccius]